MANEPNQHSVRRIVLPSGRKIDVIRFADQVEQDRDGLHVCPECRSQLVQPITWTEAGETQWQLELYCPNCEWEGGGIYNQEQIEHFEDTLEAGVEDILTDLKRLTYANMTAEVDRFCAALSADLILPEDF
jgi:ribosomal protein L37AE/L43A